MIGAVLALIASGLYLLSATRQWQSLTKRKDADKSLVMILALAAVMSHCAAVANSWLAHDGLNLAFFDIGAVTALVITLVIILSSLRKPLENLFIGLFPMAAAVLISFSLNELSGGHEQEKVTQLSGGLGWHIILSILAYSVLIIACVQAVLLYLQDMSLKKHNTRGLVQALPPLQTMDILLFEMVWVGMVLLTAAFVIGFPFIEDIRGQHLVHKTTLSIVAWLVFATLLGGRYFFGWRGIVASRWAIVGTGFLILAYFGSKFVLELLLNRGL